MHDHKMDIDSKIQKKSKKAINITIKEKQI